MEKRPVHVCKKPEFCKVCFEWDIFGNGPTTEEED